MHQPAVLILAFNRPDAVAQLVDALTPVQPPLVYAAVDGPRPDHPDDASRCAAVREVLDALPWRPQLRTLYRERNLGCGPAVADAISWFFKNESEGVILEDDILPSPDMFRFMAELLERYRDEERVMHISASNYAGVKDPAADYFFSQYVAIWGWATWRRAWQHYEFDISSWRRGPDVLRQDGLSWRTRRYLAFAFDRAAAGLGNWDYQWKYAVMRNGLAITPCRNLAVTTGFGADATNLRGASPSALPQLEEMPAPLRHPGKVAARAELDRALFSEQLARGSLPKEMVRWAVPSPRILHIGRRAVTAMRSLRLSS